MVRLLRGILGVSDLTAQVVVSEVSTYMARFPPGGHLISWAGLYPRNDESAGKRRSTRLRKGTPWLKTTLVQCAWAAARKRRGPGDRRPAYVPGLSDTLYASAFAPLY